MIINTTKLFEKIPASINIWVGRITLALFIIGTLNVMTTDRTDEISTKLEFRKN